MPSSAPQTTPTEKSEKVEYASLDHNVEARRAAVDSSVCLDQILIQLREVSPHWRRLGEAVGLATLDEINEYVCSICSLHPLLYYALCVCCVVGGWQ